MRMHMQPKTFSKVPFLEPLEEAPAEQPARQSRKGFWLVVVVMMFLILSTAAVTVDWALLKAWLR